MIAATLVIQFGEGADASALAVVELDDSRNLDAAGEVRTSFYPGDQVFFLVHHAPTLRIGSVVPTAGSVFPQGQQSFSRTVQQLFADTEPVSLSHLPAGGVTAAWYGRSTSLAQAEHQLTAADPPAIGELSYSFSGQLYRLQTPVVELSEDDSYPVAIVVTLEAVA
jgi:hypothetical protein